MPQEQISRGMTGLVHPITKSYCVIDDDGNIRMGTDSFGDAIFVHGVTGHVYVKGSVFHVISDEIEWNDILFNRSAVSPTQPALKQKPEVILNKELSRYES